MLLTGIGAGTLSGVAAVMAVRSAGFLATLFGWTAAGAALVALYGLGIAGYMTYGSKVGKRRDRERLLDLAGTVVPWTGREAVLDVGCGRGLMLVGAARRLTTGLAVGVDIWRAEDQGANMPRASLDNARREGVAGRVSVATADARDMPFADASFDAVLSHWVVHNLSDAADRFRVLDEMLRVLRPGGVLVLADIAHHEAYRDHMLASGVTNLSIRDGGLTTAVIGALSGGSFRPKAIVGRREG
jgi:arsenite methyltransferase